MATHLWLLRYNVILHQVTPTFVIPKKGSVKTYILHNMLNKTEKIRYLKLLKYYE